MAHRAGVEHARTMADPPDVRHDVDAAGLPPDRMGLLEGITTTRAIRRYMDERSRNRRCRPCASRPRGRRADPTGSPSDSSC
jgi:hypothetical protein